VELRRPAEELRVWSVVRAMEGSRRAKPCVLRLRSCFRLEALLTCITGARPIVEGSLCADTM
jgi:DNA-binding IscR family transcriptional regulator